MNGLLVRLQYLLPSLPRAEKTVAEFMSTHVPQMSDISLSTLSEETSISEATILRLCRRLGYSSYIQLRQAFAYAANQDSLASPEQFSEVDAMPTVFSKLIRNVNHSLENTQTFVNSDFDKVIDAIVSATGVYFVASGDAIISCQYAAIKFNRLGIPTFTCTDIFVQYETAMRLSSSDVVIGITNSGRSSNVVKTMKLAHERNAFTCCITRAGRSPILKYCDTALYSASIDQSIGRDSVTRRIVELVLLETLYQGIISSGGADYNQMLQNTMLSSEMNKI